MSKRFSLVIGSLLSFGSQFSYRKCVCKAVKGVSTSWRRTDFFGTFRLSPMMRCLKGFVFSWRFYRCVQYPMKFSQWRRFWGRVIFHLSTLKFQNEDLHLARCKCVFMTNMTMTFQYHPISSHDWWDEYTNSVWRMDKTSSAQTGPPRHHTCYCDLCHITIVPGELHPLGVGVHTGNFRSWLLKDWPWGHYE